MENNFNTIYRRYFAGYEPLDAFLFHADEQLSGVSLSDKKTLKWVAAKVHFLFTWHSAAGRNK